MDTAIKEKLDLLKAYFSKRQEVVMAFIFGSYANGQQTSESDVDIAVYFQPQGRLLEWEETKTYENEDAIWSEVERIAGIKTDLVVLNRASSTLAFSILQNGQPLIIKDVSLYLRLLLTISSAAEYFRDFVDDFWRIKQRSQSLSGIDQERLIRIADFLETELREYPKFGGLNQKDYENNPDLRRNVERWVENIVNASIDSAKILLASEKKRLPQTYREILEELFLLPGFDAEAAKKLGELAKLRNILTHEYIDIRFNHIRAFIQDSEPAYRALLDFVKTRIH